MNLEKQQPLLSTSYLYSSKSIPLPSVHYSPPFIIPSVYTPFMA